MRRVELGCCGCEPKEGSARKNGRALQALKDVVMDLESIGRHEERLEDKERLEDTERFGNESERGMDAIATLTRIVGAVRVANVTVLTH
jgi:hypothetical protein